MLCTEAHEQVAAYLDGELSKSAVDLFEGHLDACPSCRSLVALVAGQDLQPPRRMSLTRSDRFWERMDHVLAQEAVAPPVARVERPMSVVLALIAFVSLVWGAHNHQRAQAAEALARGGDVSEPQAPMMHRPDPLGPPAAQPLTLAAHTPHRGTF